mmetsp:Transcript_39219/g.96536  ORF Transcript_39219/g.96536 Transcript_39219/m.96536 type:complete len:218 (-) Transcript_39219:4-657(-)
MMYTVSFGERETSRSEYSLYLLVRPSLSTESFFCFRSSSRARSTLKRPSSSKTKTPSGVNILLLMLSSHTMSVPFALRITYLYSTGTPLGTSIDPVQMGYLAASVSSRTPFSAFQHPRLGMLPTTHTWSPASVTHETWNCTRVSSLPVPCLNWSVVDSCVSREPLGLLTGSFDDELERCSEPEPTLEAVPTFPPPLLVRFRLSLELDLDPSPPPPES